MRKKHERSPEAHQLDATPTTCFCPICQEFHEVKMNWTGRGVPRKFCLNCRHSQPRLFRHGEEDECRYGGQRERSFAISEMPLIPTMNFSRLGGAK